MKYNARTSNNKRLESLEWSTGKNTVNSFYDECCIELRWNPHDTAITLNTVLPSKTQYKMNPI